MLLGNASRAQNLARLQQQQNYVLLQAQCFLPVVMDNPGGISRMDISNIKVTSLNL